MLFLVALRLEMCKVFKMICKDMQTFLHHIAMGNTITVSFILKCLLS